jgi:hypothetical protein
MRVTSAAGSGGLQSKVPKHAAVLVAAPARRSEAPALCRDDTGLMHHQADGCRSSFGPRVCCMPVGRRKTYFLSEHDHLRS